MFIKLTDAYNNLSFYLNSVHILSFRFNKETNCTTITVTTDTNYCYQVKESPEYLVNLTKGTCINV